MEQELVPVTTGKDSPTSANLLHGVISRVNGAVNLGLGSIVTFNENGEEVSQSINATSIFLLSLPVGKVKAEALKRAEKILLDMGMGKEYYKRFFLIEQGYLPRNFSLDYGIPYCKGRSSESTLKLGSFELTYDGYDSNFFISRRLLLKLSGGNTSKINYKSGLKLEIEQGSKINLAELGNAITDFIAGFIKTLGIKVEELEVLQKLNGKYIDITPHLPNDFDVEEREKILFSISQEVDYNCFYFTDLTPLHPDFLHELLRYLDRKFGDK